MHPTPPDTATDAAPAAATVTADTDTDTDTAAATAPPEQRRIRLGGTTREEVLTLLGAATGSLALDWVLYERVLPFSGAFGFLLCWYLLFLAVYTAAGRLQWDALTVRERLATALAWSSGLLVLAVIVEQIGYVAVRGLDAARHWNFFTETMRTTAPLSPITSGGCLHAVVGSLEQLGLATLFSVPLGILTAVFLVEAGTTRRGARVVKPVRVLVEAMTALPSIVAGLFVLGVVILTLGAEKSGLAASLALTVMMTPIVTRAAEVVVRLVPGTLKEASYALGASQWRTVWHVVLPTARPGLTTAVVLGMARGVGETSPVLLTAGFTARMNLDPLHGNQASLPLYVWNYVKQPYPDMVARAFAGALTLMAVVLVLFVTARVLGRHRAPADRPTRRPPRRARTAGTAPVAVPAAVPVPAAAPVLATTASAVENR
ncbi:phosphate ABC transporter permease PstA [Kitasatospora sp. NPDC090308]|uniref:phosphate ABC transporter permease PstA n=1 Tax=Kitasatospora sp. NPDC090308 TaxID=3364082 RepID=UPI00380FDC3F